MKNIICQQVTLFVFLLFLCPDLGGQAVSIKQLLVGQLIQQNEDLRQSIELHRTEHQQQITELKNLLLELSTQIEKGKQFEKQE